MDIRTFTHLGLSNDGTIFSGLFEDFWVTMTQSEMVYYTETVQKLNPGEIIEVPSKAAAWLPLIVLSVVGIAILAKRR